MATAKLDFEEKKIIIREKVVNLTISIEEALVIKAAIGNVVGASKVKDLTIGIYCALEKALGGCDYFLSNRELFRTDLSGYSSVIDTADKSLEDMANKVRNQHAS